MLSAKWYQPTEPALILPGAQAMVGSRMPPSNVVSLPHRNGPLLPAVGKINSLVLGDIAIIYVEQVIFRHILAWDFKHFLSNFFPKTYWVCKLYFSENNLNHKW